MEEMICRFCHGAFAIDSDSVTDVVHCPYCQELVVDVEEEEEESDDDAECSEEDLTGKEDSDSDE